MPFSIRGKIDGLQPLLGALQGVKRKVRTKILRKAVRRAGALMLKSAKAAVKPVQVGSVVATREKIMSREGLLRKSLGIKVKVYGNGNAIAVVGPRRGFKTQIGTTTRKYKNTPAGTPIYEDPANIAHLVEFGHAGPHPAPPHPFLRPAFDSTRSGAQKAMADTIADGIAEAAKGGG